MMVQLCPRPVPSCFGTWKLLCLLRLLHFVVVFFLIFTNKLAIYSIIVGKGVICFAPNLVGTDVREMFVSFLG